MRSTNQPSIDLIVPVFNEETSIEPFLARLAEVLDGTGCAYEILFVDDGSRDGTLATLRRLRAANGRIRIISFTRNFGKEAALTAGLDHARADVVIPIVKVI